MALSGSTFRIVAAIAILVPTVGAPAAARAAESVDGPLLERICQENAPDVATRETCLEIVRAVLAPDGRLALPERSPGLTEAPSGGQGIGATQVTSTLRVTLVDVEWDAALFPRDEVDVVAAEFAFESTRPEAFVDPSGLVAVDEEGFSHPWGAIHTMGDAPLPGILPEGRAIRGWVGFEVPVGTGRLELEYRDAGGQVLVWTVTR